MRRATELLARLEKHALDEQRIVLQTLEASLTAQRDELAALDRDLATQHVKAWVLPGGPRHLAGYAAEQMERQRSLQQEARAMAAARDLAQTALRARLQSYRTMEEADQRRVERAADDMLRRSQAEVEEACALRLANGLVLGSGAA
ncbi:MAG: hypothetical protein WAS21_21670 [Geminicoccaceae bacterium]